MLYDYTWTNIVKQNRHICREKTGGCQREGGLVDHEISERDEEAQTFSYKINESCGWKYSIENIINYLVISLHIDKRSTDISGDDHFVRYRNTESLYGAHGTNTEW